MTRYTPEFEEFWLTYPARWNEDSDRYYKVGKWDAMLEWQKLDEDDKKLALYAAKKLRTGKYIKDAHRWLKHRRFDDIEPPKPKGQELPEEMANVIKLVPEPVDVNDARNRNVDALKEK